MDNIPADSINVESYHSPIDDRGDDVFNVFIDNSDDDHLDNTCDDEDSVHDEGIINDMEDLLTFKMSMIYPEVGLLFQGPIQKV